jgi:hypothetical protein
MPVRILLFAHALPTGGEAIDLLETSQVLPNV